MGTHKKDRRGRHKKDRRREATARNVQLYGSAYKLALSRVPALQRRKHSHLALLLHASIRSQIHQGATDPTVIASEALKVAEQSWR